MVSLREIRDPDSDRDLDLDLVLYLEDDSAHLESLPTLDHVL